MVRNITAISYELTAKTRKTIGEAVARWSMIRPGDRIMVGLSGGKDSAVLLVGLKRLMTRSPVPFSLVACTLDPTGGEMDVSGLRRLCFDLEVPHRLETYPLFDVMKARGTRAPCSFCANMRRGILSSVAKDEGCTSLALGHHLDDAVETALLNLFQAGRFRSFQPRMWQDRTGLYVIRPLVTTPECRIVAEAERLALPLCSADCPFEIDSQRLEIRQMIQKYPGRADSLRGNILHALEALEGPQSWAPLNH